MKVAVVHEWLTRYAGSEKVVEQILRQYPQADLYSLVDYLPEQLRHCIQRRPVTTSFLQRLPFTKRQFRSYLPLMPLAIEQFDLAEYDLVISSHHAVAKGVITRPDQLHVSYVHTPMRYAWEFQLAYLRQSGLDRGLKGAFTRLVLHYLRLWDVASAGRADCLIANSQYVARRIWKTYRRPAEVIYPPVAIERFQANLPRDRFYLTVSRCVPYKRVDLTIQAFNQLGLPLVVIGDGPGWSAMKALAGPQIQLLGSQPDAVVEDLMQRCRAFIFPAEEDFGITPVEAQAAGAPVIAYRKGGQAETVLPEKTGLLFSTQTAESLVQSVKQIESGQVQFSSAELRRQAEQFSAERFQTQLRAYIDRAWKRFQAGAPLE